jgi:glycosyltransferase involved in cell wall biosynthesis
MVGRVVFFPSHRELAENPYWTILRSSLEGLGVCFDASTSFYLSRHWLWGNRQRVHVLHFHYIQQFYAYEVTRARLRWVLRFARNLLLARLWGYRTVFTLHNLTPTYPLGPAWVDYLGHWVAANLTDCVVVHCAFARKALARRFGRRRNVHLVPHPHYIGVYPNAITSEEARAQLGLLAEHRVYLFFGGIRPNKGIEALITAFRQLSGQELRLVVVGKPWPPPEHVLRLKELATRDKRVQLLPQFVPDDEVQLYMNAADVVVLPFASILTSGSVILAMSFARPVVVPSTGCLPELVTRDVGFLYRAGTPGSLLSILQRCTEVDLQSMGRSALQKVQSFDWETVGSQTLAAYGLGYSQQPAGTR